MIGFLLMLLWRKHRSIPAEPYAMR
jgi:hypothetical protein